jgi:hypothetical protein
MRNQLQNAYLASDRPTVIENLRNKFKGKVFPPANQRKLRETNEQKAPKKPVFAGKNCKKWGDKWGNRELIKNTNLFIFIYLRR